MPVKISGAIHGNEVDLQSEKKVWRLMSLRSLPILGPRISYAEKQCHGYEEVFTTPASVRHRDAQCLISLRRRSTLCMLRPGCRSRLGHAAAAVANKVRGGRSRLEKEAFVHTGS
jgi:hypothetical protein